MPDRRGVRERSSQSNQAAITQRRDVSLNIGPASVVPANSYADHTFEYLDDGGAVFLIESGGPAHLVANFMLNPWETQGEVRASLRPEPVAYGSSKWVISRAEPKVRIHFPPAESPCLAGFLLRSWKSPGFPRVCGLSAGSVVGRDAQGSATSCRRAVLSLSGDIPVPQCRLATVAALVPKRRSGCM